MVIKNLENKIKLVLIICSLFLVGCIIISISSIWTAHYGYKKSRKPNQAGADYLFSLSGGMYNYQYLQYLDSTDDGQ